MDGDGIPDWRPLLARLRQVPHVIAASPGLYEQVLVARGARDGCALIEGILPDDERTVSDLLSTATPGAVEALEPQAGSRQRAEQRNCRRSFWAATWPRQSAQSSAIR